MTKTKTYENKHYLSEEVVQQLISKIKLNTSTLKAIANDGRSLDDIAFLYHARPKNSNWTLDRGYVGITTGRLIDGSCSRWNQHKKGLKLLLEGNTEHAQAQKKLTWDLLDSVEDYEFRLVYLGTLETILKLEKALRPEKNIGWNRSIGGSWKKAEGFTWLEEDVKLQYLSHAKKWMLNLSSYHPDSGKKVPCHIYSSRKQTDAEQQDYLKTCLKLLQEKFKHLDGDISSITPDQLRTAINEVKISLGGKPTRGVEARINWFADCDSDALLNTEGFNQYQARDSLGIIRSHIHKLVKTICNLPRKQDHHILSYNNGMAYLSASLCLKTQVLTFNNRTPASVQKQIQKSVDGLLEDFNLACKTDSQLTLDRYVRQQSKGWSLRWRQELADAA